MPSSLPQVVLALTIVSTAMAIAATAFRLYARFAVVHNAGVDDLLIVIALVATVGTASMNCMETAYDHIRLYHHPLTPQQLVAFGKSVYASLILYNVSLLFIKASILTQYLRIFPQKGFRKVCYMLMVIIFIYSNWCIWSAIFFCAPIAAFWDPSIPGSKCLSREAVWFANAAINIVTDVSIAVLPLPLIGQLNMQRRSKLGLLVVFGLVALTCVVSILRLQSVYTVSRSRVQFAIRSELIALWSVVELDTAILCSSLPTLRALLSKAFPKLMGSSHQTDQPSSKRPPLTHEELSRGYDGLSNSRFTATARGNADAEVTILQELDPSSKKIRVMTKVEQTVDRDKDDGTWSENGSTRELVSETR